MKTGLEVETVGIDQTTDKGSKLQTKAQEVLIPTFRSYVDGINVLFPPQNGAGARQVHISEVFGLTKTTSDSPA